MLNIARAAGYARQRGITFTAGENATEEEAAAAYEQWLGELPQGFTGPQRRRIKHSRSEHEHEQGVRCLRCKPESAAQAPAAWRKADAELLDQL